MTPERPDNLDRHREGFAKAMRALAQRESTKIALSKRFWRGRNEGLDDESIRLVVLPLLHGFFRRPEHSSAGRSDEEPKERPKRPTGDGKAATQPQPRWRELTFGADTLQKETFAPLSYLLPNLLPEGLCLLVSRPKLGKSWLALDIAIATA